VDDGDLDELDVGGCRVRFEHRFVDGAPATLEPGVLYVSIRHRSVLHACACGCGFEVVTPLAQHRWQLIFDGESVSLEPSVGNSGLPCRSHYFITKNEVDWRRPMTDKGIDWARRRDQRAAQVAFGLSQVSDDQDSTEASEAIERYGSQRGAGGAPRGRGFGDWLRRRLHR
jgi:hypothetical protein